MCGKSDKIMSEEELIVWGFEQGYKLAKFDTDDGVYIETQKAVEFFRKNLGFIIGGKDVFNYSYDVNEL
ncbi:hypothetical protein A7985_23300 [Pseudoalteromonas luteoviolacea]|uniref:Uncharacterized protein n=1 Tax=Pseudoalteromonas luteoviolacea TaxID=43657 RepID=A0A1C0TJT9_9GAMM|nr:hypothetical protein [Pseudoalteromonas luteoviolacea]MBQ4814041.1 hypothetical protein [Pseudoalteromonas luteoviolacea]OCQ18698.1 hypothetical protein A7985_23300 [Pseudoalteromonas luteoviolacea]